VSGFVKFKRKDWEKEKRRLKWKIKRERMKSLKRARESDFNAAVLKRRPNRFKGKSSQPVEKPQSGEKKTTRFSCEEWHCALSLVDFSRMACVLDTPNSHTLDIATASSQLVQPQRKGIESSYGLPVEDTQADWILVDMSTCDPLE